MSIINYHFLHEMTHETRLNTYILEFLQIKSCPTCEILDLIHWSSCSRHSCITFIWSYYNNLEETLIPSSKKFLCVLLSTLGWNFFGGLCFTSLASHERVPHFLMSTSRPVMFMFRKESCSHILHEMVFPYWLRGGFLHDLFHLIVLFCPRDAIP